MEHWEYFAIKVENDLKWKDSTGRTGKLNKNDWQEGYANFLELLNGLGAEGWEQ